MDLQLTGRTVTLVGVDTDLHSACATVLKAEGANVIGAADGLAPADIVIASSAGHPAVDLLDCDSAEVLHAAWDAVVRAIEHYRLALPGMVERGWGRFVWIGSAAARSLDADDDELDAIVSLAMMAAHKVVAAEAGPAQVTANAVLHGGAATDDDVAHAVAFLCSQGAGYLTGVTLTVDGGVGSAMF